MYKGDIKDFPKEVVEKMLERQFEQTGKKDIKVFEENKMASMNEGGFLWTKTKEENNFWFEVISIENFDLFFQKYPKSEKYICPVSFLDVKQYDIFEKQGDYLVHSSGIKVPFNDKWLKWVDTSNLKVGDEVIIREGYCITERIGEKVKIKHYNPNIKKFIDEDDNIFSYDCIGKIINNEFFTFKNGQKVKIEEDIIILEDSTQILKSEIKNLFNTLRNLEFQDYKIEIEKINIGCWKDVYVSELEELIKL